MSDLTGPALVVVTGYPASGKTTLARQIGAALGLTVISKDDIKEPLGEVLGAGDLAWSHTLGQATYAVMFGIAATALAADQVVILEANFEAERGGNSIRRLLAEHGARCVRVVMTADGDVLLRRYRARAQAGERHPVHLDQENDERMAALVAQPYEPPEAPGPLIVVDGNDPSAVDASAVAASVRDALGG